MMRPGMEEEVRADFHMPYFEALSKMQEATPEWAEVSSGLLVLRALDDRVRANGDETRWCVLIDKTREAVEGIDIASPFRRLLLEILDAVTAGRRPDMRRAAPLLLEYAGILERQGDWPLAADVYRNIVRHAGRRREAEPVRRADERLAICSERLDGGIQDSSAQ